MEGALPEEPLTLADAAAWRAWLDHHEQTHDGVWLRLAKKGVTEPTSLGYQEALLEALCSGWIDGQRKSADPATFVQRFTPRRARSLWSLRNIGLVTELIQDQRMRERGQAEINRAKEDGRWDRAYAGPTTIQVPPELEAALAANPAASRTFAAMNRTQRYAVLHTLVVAPNPTVLAARVERAVLRLLQD